MATLQEYKCPRCGGALNFDSSSQKVKCPYCDTEFEVSALASYDQGLEEMQPDQLMDNVDAGSEWSEGETEGMFVYVCNSCGGEIVGDSTLGATKCPYCDNPVVVKEKFAGDLKPDCIIPFKLDKNAAMEAFKKHVNSRKLVPQVFKDQGHIDEIKGVYVPVWLYGADAQANITYRGQRVRHWSDRDNEYIETSYYALQRAGNISFDDVPVDGSAKMDDAIMQSLEPFDTSEAVDFQTAYLAGYLADRYDADAEQQLETANTRIRNTVESSFYSTVAGYSNVMTEKSSVQLQNVSAKYALYPVWMLSTKWKDETYLFAMNGQTGKFVGDLPVDKSLSRKIFALVTLGVAAAALVFGFATMWL